MRQGYFLLLLFVVLFSACVPNKKIVYLQRDDLKKKDLEKVQKDSVLRSYALQPYEYKIQPEDVLSISVNSLSAEEYDFFSDVNQQINFNAIAAPGAAALWGELVDKQGHIEFPVVGKIKVAGFTIGEIREKVQVLSSQYLKNPVIKIRLLNFRYTVLGEVNKEGTITTFNNRTSMMEAIGLAGGFNDLADRANVKVIRQQGDDADIFYLNLLDEEFLTSSYYYVHQNDVIVVPPLKQRPFRNYFGQNLGILLSFASLILLILNLTSN